MAAKGVFFARFVLISRGEEEHNFSMFVPPLHFDEFVFVSRQNISEAGGNREALA